MKCNLGARVEPNDGDAERDQQDNAHAGKQAPLQLLKRCNQLWRHLGLGYLISTAMSAHESPFNIGPRSSAPVRAYCSPTHPSALRRCGRFRRALPWLTLG